MKPMAIVRGVMLLVAAGLSVSGCGWGSSPTSSADTPPLAAGATIFGTAAAGAPIVAGEVFIIDSQGARRSVAIAADGSYELDVSGLTGPFLIQVVGMAGGRPAVFHSLALQEEIGATAINITPLTEILCAIVLQQDLQDLFNASAPELSTVTALSLANAESLIADKLAALFAHFGVTGQSVRTTPFETTGSGMDGLLDAINVLPVEDVGTGALRYELRVVTQQTPVLLDPFDLAGSPDVPFDAADAAALNGLAASLTQINARLQELTAQFASALPAVGDVTSYYASDFLNNGLDLATYLTEVLLTEPYVGHATSRVAVERWVSANEIQVSYAIRFFLPSFPKPVYTTMRRVGDRWVIAGNQQLGAVDVNYMARVFSKRLAEAELAARTDVVTKTEYDPQSEQDRLAYYLKVADPNAEDVDLDIADPNQYIDYHLARIGFPNDENFGVLAVAGEAYNRNGIDKRDLQRRYSRFIGTANGRVRTYMVFAISSREVSPNVDHVQVTGPGLPAEGLTLTRPRANVWREHFILKNDFMDWNSFNTERCQNFDAPADCALDWSQIVTGSTFRYSFRDTNGQEIGSTEKRLLGRPLTEDRWLAGKDRFFPRLQLTGGQEYYLANVLDTTPGAPYADGGATTFEWKLPTDPIVKMHSFLAWRNYNINNAWGSDNERKESHVFSLIGKAETTQAVQLDTAGWLTNWAWATIVARDVYGNELNHEVSPQNPYGERCLPTAQAPICKGAGYTLPPRVKAQRTYPKLANYFHMMHYAEAQVPNREDYFAQWDVIVLNPQATLDQGVSLARIREINPGIKILAWIPVGQSSLDFEMSTSMPGLPLDASGGGGEYFLRDTNGNLMQWWWGGYFMNPYKNDFAFPKHVISYLEAHYLVPGMYDGIMFDCLWYNAPHWFSPTGRVEVNGNSADNETWFSNADTYVSFWVNQDSLDYRAGFTYLLQTLGSTGHRPAAILTGNGIDSGSASHLASANGGLVESAYGDEFGSVWSTWTKQWEIYSLSTERLGRSPNYIIVNADVRHGRTDPEAREVPGMTDDDLRRFRLSLTTTLLRDGYFAFDRGDGNHAQFWWFREYDVDLGNPAPGYEAPTSFRTDQYGAGTYSREFANGSVVVNPTAATISVTFPNTRADASTGSRGTTFVIPANDGRIYVK